MYIGLEVFDSINGIILFSNSMVEARRWFDLACITILCSIIRANFMLENPDLSLVAIISLVVYSILSSELHKASIRYRHFT